MNREDIVNAIWKRVDNQLTDPEIPETNDLLATLYVNNYMQAIQALHNMKEILYKIVEKYGLTDDINQRFQQMISMSEEDYRVYTNAKHLITSGNNLIKLSENIHILAELRKKTGTLDNFNNLPDIQKKQMLMDVYTLLDVSIN